MKKAYVSPDFELLNNSYLRMANIDLVSGANPDWGEEDGGALD